MASSGLANDDNDSSCQRRKEGGCREGRKRGEEEVGRRGSKGGRWRTKGMMVAEKQARLDEEEVGRRGSKGGEVGGERYDGCRETSKIRRSRGGKKRKQGGRLETKGMMLAEKQARLDMRGTEEMQTRDRRTFRHECSKTLLIEA